jgi:DNA-binding MarR family transcriptional regulator
MSRQSAIPTAKRPIGFWIKAADRALDKRGDAIHARHGFSRRRWQVLSLIVQTEPVHTGDLVARLAPMMAEPAARDEIAVLAQRGIVTETSGRLATTPTGRALHDRLAAEQMAFRRQAMAGIADADYAAAVRTLERIVENIGAEDQPRTPST